MKSDVRRKGDTALSELAKTYELVRDELTDRLDGLAGRIDDLDTRRLRGRAYTSARQLRSSVQDRVRPMTRARSRRRFPWGLLVLGGLTFGLAWLLYDQRRRDMIQGRITQIGARTREQVAPNMKNGISGAVDGMMGKVRSGGRALDEMALKTEVEAAITGIGEGGGLPDGLQVAVEGRTVYLRGMVVSTVADQAAARAQQVEGVAAVVNLTTVPQSSVEIETETERPKPATGRRAGI